MQQRTNAMQPNAMDDKGWLERTCEPARTFKLDQVKVGSTNSCIIFYQQNSFFSQIHEEWSEEKKIL